MADLAKLVVSLEAQTAKYQRKLEQANRKLGKFERTQKKGIRAIGTAFKALAGFVAAVQFGRIIKQNIDLADSFQKTSLRLGINVKALSELTFAAQRADVTQRELTLGLQRFQRRVAEAAQGTGEAQSALKELNISAKELTALALEDQFARITKALSGVAGQSNKVRLAFKLFDSEGVGLLQLMEDGASGLALMRLRAQELGFSFDKDMVQKMVDAKDAMTSFNASIKSISLTMTTALAPAIKFVADQLTDLTTRTTQEAIKSLQDQIRTLVALRDMAQGEDRDAFDQLINGLAFTLELTVGKEQKEAAIVERLKEQSKLIDEIIVKEKKRGALLSDTFIAVEQFSIETEEDRILRPEVREDIERTERSFSLLNDKMAETNKLGQELGLTFASAFEDAIVSGAKLSDVFKGLLQDIIRILVRATITGPAGSFLSGVFGSLFGGPKAHGGPVSPGKAFLVGEQGPELFVPNAAGRIIPGSGGGVSVSTVVNVDARADRQQLVAELGPIMQRVSDSTLDRVRHEIREGSLV